MAQFTLDDLKQVLRTAAGEDESVDLDGDILDTDFGELGYDSLAIMETAGVIERSLGVQLPDDEVSQRHTPSEFIALVNSAIEERV